MVSKWETDAGGIRARSQAALDRALATASVDARLRFRALIAGTDAANVVADVVGRAANDVVNMVRHPDDARWMTLVPSGVAPYGPANEPVWLPAYYIDVYPVTVADWDRFRAATGHTPARYWGTQNDAVRSDHPVVGVSYADACAYATWVGRTLPTTQQWERAARGPHGWLYPWGPANTGRHCNARMRGRDVGTTTSVTWYPGGGSSYGAHDMLGNVWEWTRTRYGAGYAARGGAFTAVMNSLDVFSQIAVSETSRRDDLGFRTVVAAATLAEVLYA
jgi:formylglycine-generating enzyme required for sulfatase activity